MTSPDTTGTYLEIMAHWRKSYPAILRVHYEDVVEDLEGSVHRILDTANYRSSRPALSSTRPSAATTASGSRRPVDFQGLRVEHYEQWRVRSKTRWATHWSLPSLEQARDAVPGAALSRQESGKSSSVSRSSQSGARA